MRPDPEQLLLALFSTVIAIFQRDCLAANLQFLWQYRTESLWFLTFRYVKCDYFKSYRRWNANMHIKHFTGARHIVPYSTDLVILVLTIQRPGPAMTPSSLDFVASFFWIGSFLWTYIYFRWKANYFVKHVLYVNYALILIIYFFDPFKDD